MNKTLLSISAASAMLAVMTVVPAAALNVNSNGVWTAHESIGSVDKAYCYGYGCRRYYYGYRRPYYGYGYRPYYGYRYY